MPNHNSDFHLAAHSPLVHFELCAKIQNAVTKRLETPKANVLQRRMAEAIEVLEAIGVAAIRILVTKIRQCGGTTFAVEVIYHISQRRNTDSLILANIADNSRGILERMKVFAANDRFPWNNPLDPNKSVLTWANGSTATITSAESMNPGISKPRQAVLFSESAKYPRGGVKDDSKIFASILPSLNDAGIAIAESTPDGASGVHYDLWQKALTLDEFLAEWQKGNTAPGNGWVKVFAAWFEFEENVKPVTEGMKAKIDATLTAREANGRRRYSWTYEQIAWRRAIMESECGGSEELFDEFYPEDDVSCVEGSVRVSTNRGMIPIREVRPGDQTNGKTIIAQRQTGVREILSLTTAMGFRVVCTPDHRIACQDGSFAMAADLLNRWIALEQTHFATSHFEAEWQSFGGVQSALVIDEKWGRWIGAYMGDGSFYKNQVSICCDGKDRDFVAMLVRLSRRLFGNIWRLRRPRHAKAIELRSYSAAYRPLFKALDLIEVVNGGMKRKIHVPECIWRSPKEVVREFLRGLFEADGWISATGRTAMLFAKDAEFLREVQQLLLGFGIQGALRGRIHKAQGKEYLGHQLYVYQSQIDRFIEEVGFLSKRKNARCTKGYKRRSKTGRSAIIQAGFDVVTSIEPAGKAPVFDLETTGEHTFSAGGIKVHNCFLSSGRPRFNMAAIRRLELAAPNHPPETGSLVEIGENVDFQTDPTGFGAFQIWERPRVGCSYIVWCDPATGEDQTESNNPDRHSIGVLRTEYMEGDVIVKDAVVARVRPPFTGTTILTADYIELLSEYYGGAMVVLEINMGLHILERLQDKGVPLYKREVVDPHDRETKKFMFGWKLKDRDQRREIVDGLALAFHNDRLDVWCPNIIGEAKTFIYDKNGKEQARPGCHDDDILGLAMAYRCRGSATLLTQKVRRRRRPQDYRQRL